MSVEGIGVSDQLKQYTKLSFKNKTALATQLECSCYHCCLVMPSNLVISWADKGETGICPKCGIDALLPGSYSAPQLKEISQLFAH